MNQSFDYLIVGQGLAGSLLAYELIQNGAKVLVIDNPIGASSSKVAAGIFNPITGKRFVKTWICDDIFVKLVPYYQHLESKFGIKFLHQTTIIRPLESIKEQNHIISLSDDLEHDNYVEFSKGPSEIFEITDVKFGVLSTKLSGWVDLPILLEYMKKYLQNIGCYKDEVFDYEKVKFIDDAVSYNEIQLKKIVFCEGYSAINNPYFNWLPFNSVKGEVINIKMKTKIQNYILLKGIFILPISEDIYKIGATYNWSDKSTDITTKGKAELEEKLQKLIDKNYQIVSQHAGIRPATVDRRPFLGLHPIHETLAVFNGLGTKGVSLGPYFATQFANFLINGEQLSADVNINRFSSLYLSSDF